MMKKQLILFLVVLGFQSCDAQQDSEIVTLYLVRHSEKELTTNQHSDPPLTQCGVQRSEKLSRFLSDVPLDVIYSTDYTRTKNTALPTANAKGLEIRQYNPQELQEFSKELIKRQQNALIVAHSNTTGVLAGLLVGKEIGSFDLDIYNRVYQVVMTKNSRRLQVLHTAFECIN
jgi:broad specificity phosphatase PhoE